MSHRPLYAVTLVNARTGHAHYVGGNVMTLFTRDPDETARDLLRNRDPRQWSVEARVFATRDLS